MAKIPFDIKFRPQIESGEYKVVDNDNHNIRIICWDKKTEKKYGYCIVGLVEFAPKHEESTYYTIDGKARLRDKHPCLFLVTPEPEMSEWELAIAKYRPPTDSKETIQRIAAELLDLARKQLQPEIDAEIEKAYKTADEVQYRKGREMAIEPGEPADLIRKDFKPLYKKLGREKFIELLKAHPEIENPKQMKQLISK